MRSVAAYASVILASAAAPAAMADEQARKEAALTAYRSKLLHHKARAASPGAPRHATLL